MGVTPNRGYPYPDLGDPMAMTTDLQALAEAYDTDLQGVEDTVVQRPFFRASAEARQPYGTADPAQVSFDVMEVNTGGAILSGTSMPRDRFVPLVPGLWCFTATISYPAWLDIQWLRIQLLSNTEVAASTTTVMPNGSGDGNRTISVTGMEFMSGTAVGNPIIVRLFANAAGTRSVFPMFSRSLTGFLVSAT